MIAATLLALAERGYCDDAAKTFEVASVTPCKPGTSAPPGEHAGMVRFIYPGGRFEAKATTVKYLMEWAYGILPAQHSSGPSWMENERYDIVAKAEGKASDHDMKMMARALLAERFKLTFHVESREVPVVMVSLGKNQAVSPPGRGLWDQNHAADGSGPEDHCSTWWRRVSRWSS